MKGQEKMKIQHKGETYEGIPSANALGMALFEASGMRDLIDRRCRYDPERRILSPGMVVKALIGPTFNISTKVPLYRVESAYSSAPTERLFGSGVSKDDLYDNALGRGLDSLFDADLSELFAECSDLATERYGFDSNIFHMDSTDVSVWGIRHPADKDGAAVPEHNCHPKDGHKELLQYEMQAVTDSNNIIRYMRPYDGNVNDSVMDADTIEWFGERFSEDERRDMIMVGDCKLPTARNMCRMIDLGMCFVSKCAENFKGGTRNKVLDWASSAVFHRVSGNGLMLTDTHLDVELSKGRTERLRFVAFRWEGKVRKAMDRIMEETKADAFDFVKRFRGIRFRTEKAAMKEFIKHSDRIPDTYSFKVSTRFYESMSPDSKGWWELDLVPLVSDVAVRRLAEREQTVVLVTNLDHPVSEGEDTPPTYRPKSSWDVVKIYNSEYKVERSFRFLKSGVGMNSVYLQTPSRENAMMFVLSIAVLISNIADAIFKRRDLRLKGRTLTMYNLAYELQTTLVTYSRSENTLRLMGPAEVTDSYFKYTDALWINPQLLLGYAGE